MKLTSVLQALALMLSGLLMAFAARVMHEGSNCPSDEHNWSLIAEQVAQGVDWPISGPLHFALTRALASYSGLETAQALAFIGTFSVPILLTMLIFAYDKLGIKKPIHLLILLACNTYFLAPLFESRPQQWGQVMVLMGLIFAWRAMSGLMTWWAYALLMTLVACVHILSFAVLGAASVVLWAVLYALNLTTALTLARLALYTLPASVIFLISDGPYAAMIQDIRSNHLQVAFQWQRLSTEVVILAGTMVSLAGLTHRFARPLASFLLSMVKNHPVIAWIVVSVLAVSGLVIQALILPAEAWIPYGNSATLFFVSQLGNLFFIALFALGLESTRQSHLQGLSQEHTQASFILLLSVGIIGAAALAASFRMLHTNWLLRILNYLCLFMAPFAAIGFDKLKLTRGKWCIWLTMVAISFVAVVRPTSLFNC